MYGQKQIFQCLFIVFLLSILNFYRSAIKQNRDIMKMKLNRLQAKSTTNLNKFDNFDPNIINFCPKNPFGLFVRIECKYGVNRICYDKFEMWTKQQCEQYCCKREKTSFNKNANEIHKFNEKSDDEEHKQKKPLNPTEKYKLLASATLQPKEFVCRNTTSSILDVIALKHTTSHNAPDENVSVTETETKSQFAVWSRGEKTILLHEFVFLVILEEFYCYLIHARVFQKCDKCYWYSNHDQ